VPVRLTSQAHITVGGPLPPEVMDLLVSWTVDDSLTMADVFVMTFRDPDSSVLTKGKFKLGAPVTIGVNLMEEGAPVTLIEGEITAIESEFGPDGSITVVRGFDRAHRLFRGRKNEVFVNAKASTVAQQVAGKHGLTPDVQATKTVFPVLAQVGESDWQFLKRLAFDAGYELTVEAKKLRFKAPAPLPGPPIKLVMGDNLVNFRATLTAAEQVGTIEARAYDSLNQKVLTAAPKVKGGPTTGTPFAQVNGAFPTQDYVHSRAFQTVPEATTIATALAEDLAHNHAELHGEVGGDPNLRAGVAVKVEDVGPAFSGTYRVTATRHRFDGVSGYTTEFSVAGRRAESMLGLASSGAGGAGGGRITGLMVAVVSDNKDPMNLGRVKVKIPALGDTYLTDWAQVVYPGAGQTPPNGRGLYLVPQVNDQVVVGFEMGDPDRPFILGGVYNTKQKPFLPSVVKMGATDKRTLTSRTGLKVIMDDTVGQESILIADKMETVMVKLVAKPTPLVHIKSAMDVKVEALKSVMVDAKMDVTVKALANVVVESVANTTVKATGNMELSAARIKIAALGPLELSGAVIKLN